jgi:hypothetical protein
MIINKKLSGLLVVAAVVAVSLAPSGTAHALRHSNSSRGIVEDAGSTAATQPPAVASVSSTGVTLPAGVQQVNSATFVQTVNPCSCTVTIDGYTFNGMPYYDGTTKSAVGLWFELLAQPGYVSRPPVTSISTTTTVSGTVDPLTP